MYDASMALPDFPSLKQEISNFLTLQYKAALRQRLGPFNKSAYVTYHEGNASDIANVDGDVVEMDLQKAGVEEELQWSDLGHMTPAETVEAMQRHGVEIAEQMIRRFMGNLDETLTAAGRVTNLQGRALDADLLLEIYRDIEFGFDDEGRPSLPDLMPTNPAANETVARIYQDDDFMQKLSVLVDEKREAWLARESDRKLVD